MREGSTVDAVRASIALPGLFRPALRDGETLVDGGIVNPVPVSLARAMGADVVIAVDLGSDRVGRHLAARTKADTSDGMLVEWKRRLQENLGEILPARAPEESNVPSLHEVLFTTIDIMQAQIARRRLLEFPPDVLVTPKLAYLRLLDFQRAKEAIEEGKRAVEAKMGELGSLRQSPS